MDENKKLGVGHDQKRKCGNPLDGLCVKTCATEGVGRICIILMLVFISNSLFLLESYDIIVLESECDVYCDNAASMWITVIELWNLNDNVLLESEVKRRIGAEF